MSELLGAGLAPDRWTTPSLCAGWSVHEVLGHMTATATMTPLGFSAGWPAPASGSRR